MTQNTQVSLDAGLSFQQCDSEVRVSRSITLEDGTQTTLTTILNSEGVIHDLMDEHGEICATSTEMWDDIVSDFTFKGR